MTETKAKAKKFRAKPAAARVAGRLCRLPKSKRFKSPNSSKICLNRAEAKQRSVLKTPPHILRKSAGLKVVFDTNVVISATLFGSGLMKPLRLAWQAGRVVPVICKETRAELLRVLAYEKFKLGEADIARVLALYLPDAQFHKLDLTVNNGTHIPLCRDERSVHS